MSADLSTRLKLLVTVDPNLLHGAPCFSGTHVPVRLLVDDLKGGFTVDDFLSGCPNVKRQQVEDYLDITRDLVTEHATA